MIVVTTLKGERLAINDELIERVEDDHPTRIILTSGTCYMVAEPVEEVVRRCREGRAAVHALALRHAAENGEGPAHGHRDGVAPGAHRARTGQDVGAASDAEEKIVRLDRFTTPTDGSR